MKSSAHLQIQLVHLMITVTVIMIFCAVDMRSCFVQMENRGRRKDKEIEENKDLKQEAHGRGGNQNIE